MSKSKASTLAHLTRYEELNIPKPVYFTHEQCRQDGDRLLDAIGSELANRRLAVRSSCGREDSCEISATGAFLSLLNIPADEREQLRGAIDKVFASYGEIESEDQDLVQSMVEDPVLTGVIMTRSLSDGAHFFVINYDDESGRTDTITGGTHTSKTVYVYRDAREGDFDSTRLKRIVALASRLEEICRNDSLDIEFSISTDGKLHLLQVRPICSSRHWAIASRPSRTTSEMWQNLSKQGQRVRTGYMARAPYLALCRTGIPQK